MSDAAAAMRKFSDSLDEMIYHSTSKLAARLASAAGRHVWTHEWTVTYHVPSETAVQLTVRFAEGGSIVRRGPGKLDILADLEAELSAG